MLLGKSLMAQSTPYVLTDFPVSLMVPDTTIWIKWAGVNTNDSLDYPDSGGVIYYSSSPGGSNLENYTDSITVFEPDTGLNLLLANNYLFTGTPKERGSKFIPENNGMTPGKYYFVVAYRFTITNFGVSKDTFFISNEVPIIIETPTAVELTAPQTGAEIEELTPTFSWKSNPGVPYYHIMVSDEEISFDVDSGTVGGLSIIWEAITANNQIIYGSSDPSGNLSADPPPMSPGLGYSWVVLNNYGNHPAYSSTKFGIPANFSIAGEGLDAPVNLYPLEDTTISSLLASEIEFKWCNYDSIKDSTYLDENVNTYKIYVYVNADLGDEIDAKTVVWSTEVTAGQFAGDSIASISFNAASVLTDNTYSWKVIAIDAKGAGTSGPLSTFTYQTPSGTMVVKTREKITSGGSTVEKNVGLVELKLEVLDGSNDAPLLFYTDNNGYFSRERQAGTYRVTTIKEGFNSQSKTITVYDTVDNPDAVIFYLERPDATVFGKVIDNSGLAVNLAELVAVSERGDTVYAETDPSGNYSINCYGADWSIYARKDGYISSETIDTTAGSGESVNLESRFVLTKNPYTLSGFVKNSDGDAILGAKVQLLLEGVVLDQIPSTPQTGAYSFTVENGTYVISAEKVGFSSYKDTVIVLSSMQKNIVMSAGASLVSGYVVGSSYNSSGQLIYGPIKNATVKIIDTSSTSPDTVTATTDAVYGSYSKSIIGGGKYYKVQASKSGYALNNDSVGNLVLIENGKTYTNVNDTIMALASFTGRVSYTSQLSGVAVNLINLTTSDISASSQSDAVGDFEVRDISSGGDILKLSAGLEGYVVDSIILYTSIQAITSDSVRVVDGRVLADRNGEPIDSVVIYLESGDKNLNWSLLTGSTPVTTASIKVKSPILKTISVADTLSGVGPDNYIVIVDADADSIIDCSYHIYTLSDGADTNLTDTIALSAIHNAQDTIETDSLGYVTLSMEMIGDTADSGYVYYRDVSSPTFKSAALVKGATALGRTPYSSVLTDAKDGSQLIYYFTIYRGADKFGYDQEVYRAYVKPNTSVISRIAINPISQDTMIVAADDELEFSFGAYYGSKYKLIDSLPETNVSWGFATGKAFGCSIDGSGSKVTINTAKNGSGDSIVVLQATFNSVNGYKVASGVDSVTSVYFKVLQYKIDSIAIRRTNEDGRGYITNSSSERSEFIAVGIIKNADSTETEVNVTPVWRVIPTNAGIISDGVFRPSDNYFGRVDVYADAGRKDGYYYQLDGRGLPVRFIIPVAGDTVTNGLGYLQNNEGCEIVFPANEVALGDQIEMSLEVEDPNNLVFLSSTIKEDSTNEEKLTGKFDLVGSVYDINVEKGILDTANGVSETVILGVPLAYQEEVKAGNPFYIAHWNVEGNEWIPIEATTKTEDGSRLIAPVNHFSRYAILAQPRKTNSDFNIYPNPFSPHVKPKARDGIMAQFGTCITVNPVSKNFSTLNVQIDIMNMVGTKVWSVLLQNAVSSKEYKIWWDGKTVRTTRALGIDHLVGTEQDGVYMIEGERICRNGRYIAVLTIEDSDTKKQYKKSIILFK